MKAWRGLRNPPPPPNSKRLSVSVSPPRVWRLRVCAYPEEVVFACFRSSFQEPEPVSASSAQRFLTARRRALQTAMHSQAILVLTKRYTRRKTRTASTSVSALVPSGWGGGLFSDRLFMEAL